jgi:hypothetical protein
MIVLNNGHSKATGEKTVKAIKFVVKVNGRGTQPTQHVPVRLRGQIGQP